jgi:radical SAM superfamily enzyme YgiQ (UPF0313 family)
VSSDVIGISAITRTAKQSYELAKRIRVENPDARIVFGGPHSSALPHDALAHGDIIVMNEGDKTFVELMQHLQGDINSRNLKNIKGIAYNDIHGDIIINEKRAFLTSEELSALPFPVYTQDALKHMTHTVINTSRGCPFGCEYCAVIENFGRKFRYLDVERTVELIEFTLRQTRKPIFFGDDSFSANPTRVKKLMERILEKGIKMPRWLAQVRVESAADTELITLMKKANCERVCIGFESINDDVLKAFKKRLRSKRTVTPSNVFMILGFPYTACSFSVLILTRRRPLQKQLNTQRPKGSTRFNLCRLSRYRGPSSQRNYLALARLSPLNGTSMTAIMPW